MDVETVLVADYANSTRDGKLNVMGVFNQITSSKFPARHPSMFIVARLSASAAEKGMNRKVTIKLINEDGTDELVDHSAQFPVPEPVPGRRVEYNHILEVRELVFPVPGTYQVAVLVDNDERNTARVYVMQSVEEN